jgi:hypothetical protein
MRLLIDGHITTGDSLLDTGLQALEVAVTDEGVRLYAATGATGGLTLRGTMGLEQGLDIGVPMTLARD